MHLALKSHTIYHSILTAVGSGPRAAASAAPGSASAACSAPARICFSMRSRRAATVWRGPVVGSAMMASSCSMVVR